jgi:hypothetical protein
VPDASRASDGTALIDAGTTANEAGYPLGDGGWIRADRFITKVVSFSPLDCAGWGIPEMPGILEGPPLGAGTSQGSLDVVSLGNGGEIVVSFEPNAIVDGPGVDFIVFENPFFIGGNPNNIYAEPAEISVSEDGINWKTFPCTATSYPYGACGGWHIVYSNPDNGISPIDPAVAGGDAFDLADVGMPQARFVKIIDKIIEPCPATGAKPNTNGFDLDAIAIVNALHP